MKIYLSLTSSPSSPRIPIDLADGTSSSSLRTMAANATKIPLTNLKLIFRGRMIADKKGNNVVEEFKLEDECVVHVMGKAVSQPSSAAAAPPSVPAVAGASVTMPAATVQSNANATIQSALTTLRLNDAPTYKTALSTASKLLNNIIQNPMEEKYRSIKKSNAAFNKRLGGVNGGEALLLSAGFVIEGDVFVLRPSEDAWPKLVEAGDVIGKALREAEANSSAPMSGTTAGFGAPTGTGAAGFSGVPPIPNMVGMPGMEAAMQNMLSNPEQLQAMMSNPMVQQMIRNDPRLANNPMLQQSLDALQSNPDMIRQFSSMMNDPGVRANVSRMMQQQQQQAGGAGASGNADPFAGAPDEMRRQMQQLQEMQNFFGGQSGSFNLQQQQPQLQNGQQPSQGSSSSTNNANDSEMTEEEMIAEAIARSLRES